MSGLALLQSNVVLQASQTLNLSGVREARAVAYSPSGKFLAVGGGEGVINIFLPSGGGEVVEKLKPHEACVWGVCFAGSEFGTVLASCGADRKVVIQRRDPFSQQWEVLFEDNTHAACVRSVAFTLAPGAPPSSFQLAAMQATSCVGLHLAAACLDGSVSIYSLQADCNWRKISIRAHVVGCNVARWATHSTKLPEASLAAAADFSDPGHKLATGGLDGLVNIWHFDSASGQSGKFLREARLPGHARNVLDLAWLPASDTAADETLTTLADDGTLHTWTRLRKLWQLTESRTRAHPGSHSLAWSLDGTNLALSLKDGNPPVKVL